MIKSTLYNLGKFVFLIKIVSAANCRILILYWFLGGLEERRPFGRRNPKDGRPAAEEQRQVLGNRHRLSPDLGLRKSGGQAHHPGKSRTP